MTEKLAGLEAVADRYDAFLLDMWGCIHDGLRVFPGVADLMVRLRAKGKRSVVLSNAPRLVEILRRQMPDFGIDPDAFDGIVTSGEAAWQALAADEHKLGRRFLHVGQPRNIGDPAGIGYAFADGVAAADFILATGAAGDGTLDLPALQPVLVAARERDLPMVCANPDLEVMRGEQRLLCAGTLAQNYEALGGRVHYHGKPHPGVYKRALALAGNPDPARVLAVGDAMRTDIAGGRAAGLDQAFIPGGIHGEALGAPMGHLPDDAAIAGLTAEYGFAPTYVLAELRW